MPLTRRYRCRSRVCTTLCQGQGGTDLHTSPCVHATKGALGQIDLPNCEHERNAIFAGQARGTEFLALLCPGLWRVIAPRDSRRSRHAPPPPRPPWLGRGAGRGWGAWGRRRAAEPRSRAGWHSGAGTVPEAGREAYRASGVSGGHERTPPSVGGRRGRWGVAGNSEGTGATTRRAAGRRMQHRRRSSPRSGVECAARLGANHPLRSGSFLAFTARVILSDLSNSHPAPLESRDMPQRPPDCSGGRGGGSFQSFG